MEERLKVFTAEIEAQWEEMLKLHSSIKSKCAALKSDSNNEDLINSLAYKLHNLYSAYEDIFKLIARFFENQIEDITRYYIGLISRMRIAIEGIRPKLLSEDSYRSLAAKCFLATDFILNQYVTPLLATGPYSYHHFYKKLE